MGKKTLYHPVSLHVVRGAAEYCGFRFGKLTQTASDPTGYSATYIADVIDMPADCKDRSLRYILARLNECFALDIHATALSADTRHKMKATIKTRIVTDMQQNPLFDTLDVAVQEIPPSEPGGGGGGEYDDWDGLRLCSVCGDRETRDDVCWACRQQEQIDRDVPGQEIYMCKVCHVKPTIFRNGMCPDCWKASKLRGAAGGGGGGGEPETIRATMNADGYVVCHFCKSPLYWSQIFRYNETPTLQLVGQSGLECRSCFALYDMNHVLLQGPMGADDDFGD